jgi:hypothetical protein
VELFLNLVWLSVSLLLVVGWIWAVRAGHTKAEWRTFISLVLLLILLFPVISMTDDLAATSLAEAEHLVRRSEIAHAPTATVDPFGVISPLAMLFICMACLCACFERRRFFFTKTRLLSGFARTTGIRPPPMLASAA